MKNNLIKIVTCIGLVLIFALQGIWLYNTYSFYEKELEDKLEKEFVQSIEKEVYLRLNNSSRIPSGRTVTGAKPENSSYTNAIIFSEFLSSEGYPFSISKLDSIWKETLKKNLDQINYSIVKIGADGEIIEKIETGFQQELSSGIRIQKPIKTDRSEMIQTTVKSPNRMIFSRMLLLLITSFIIAIFIGYCLFFQIRIITRQDRIAEIRQDFTHAMIHDMKNPITTILMGVNTLKGGKLDNKPQLKDQYYSILTAEGEHLLSLTNKILTIAKFEEKKVNLSKQHIDIKSIFDKLIEKYKLNSEKNIQFITEYNNINTIYADREYMYEAFSNLIDNAIKYSKNEVVITIVCLKNASNTIIKIKDNGIGISLRDQKRIFDKFERVISLKKENHKSGFGLGLNHVYQVVTAHDGEIKINSLLDLYSEFTIIIPNKNDKTIINRR
ncbi:sensor histidine kinase [Dysgonomonas termitidis]|uniref:histidine kinase n=1 Tax=Dysgonomonas termitidis TaxID=1516126 RepID=A0ABV9KZL3_9BACT